MFPSLAGTYWSAPDGDHSHSLHDTAAGCRWSPLQEVSVLWEIRRFIVQNDDNQTQEQHVMPQLC